MTSKLPPLPPSDFESMKNPAVRKFWGDNEINRVEVGDFKKCIHEFKIVPAGAKCSLCNLGLIDQFLEIREGKLFRKGKLLI